MITLLYTQAIILCGICSEGTGNRVETICMQIKLPKRNGGYVANIEFSFVLHRPRGGTEV